MTKHQSIDTDLQNAQSGRLPEGTLQMQDDTDTDLPLMLDGRGNGQVVLVPCGLYLPSGNLLRSNEPVGVAQLRSIITREFRFSDVQW